MPKAVKYNTQNTSRHTQDSETCEIQLHTEIYRIYTMKLYIRASMGSKTCPSGLVVSAMGDSADAGPEWLAEWHEPQSDSMVGGPLNVGG